MEPEQVRNIMDSMIRKLYDMELEELGRSGWQDEKLLSEVRKLLEKNKASNVPFSFFWNAEGNRFKWYKILTKRLCVENTHSLLKSLVRLAAHVSNGLKSRIRPVVGRI